MNGMDQFEAVAVVEYKGAISSTGDSQGHYTCDIKYPHSQLWFRTNDSSIPFPISLRVFPDIHMLFCIKSARHTKNYHLKNNCPRLK